MKVRTLHPSKAHVVWCASGQHWFVVGSTNSGNYPRRLGVHRFAIALNEANGNPSHMHCMAWHYHL